MAEARVTQVEVESALAQTATARATQHQIEAGLMQVPNARVTQYTIEAAILPGPPPPPPLLIPGFTGVGGMGCAPHCTVYCPPKDAADFGRTTGDRSSWGSGTADYGLVPPAGGDPLILALILAALAILALEQI